jgi:RimJ/RimL family protein N-acetyltransferase
MGIHLEWLTERDELLMIYERLKADDLFWCLTPDRAHWERDEWLAMYDRDHVLVLAGYVDGRLAGFATLFPYRLATQVGEIGLCAFRGHFHEAAPLCREALLWVFSNIDVVTLVGHVPAPNHHILRMLERVGFGRQCLIPKLMWYERKHDFVDGWLVMASKDSVQKSAEMEVCMSGSPSAPAVEPVPEKQATKSLSAGASAAAQAQRERQKKNRGLTASIMTQRNMGVGGLAGTQTGKTTLG